MADKITLKSVVLTDADFLLKLKNDPVTRKFAIITHNKIKRKDHIKWLTKRMLRDGFYIIFKNKTRVGDLRFEPDEVVIHMDQKYRNQGIGYKVISGIKKRPLYAKIVEGHIASFNLFTKCGFKFKKYKDGYYILCLKN